MSKSKIIKGVIPYPLEREIIEDAICNKLDNLEKKLFNAILKKILNREPLSQDFSDFKIYQKENEFDRYQLIYKDCILGQVVKSIEPEIKIEFFPKSEI